MWLVLIAWVGVFQVTEARSRPVPMVEVSAGWEEGEYFRWATELAGRTKRSRLLVQPTNGSAQNVAQLASGRVGLAIAQSDVVWHSRYDSGRSPSDPELVVIGELFSEMVHLVVPADSDIDELSDLSGRRVGVGAVGSGSLFNALDVLAAADVPDVHMDFSSAFLLERLSQGQLDAALVTMLAPIDLFKVGGGYKVVSISESSLFDAPYYQAVQFPPEYGEGTSIQLHAVLVGHKDLPEQVVTELLDLGNLSVDGVTIPLHPAAERWFRDRGAEIPEVDGEFEPLDLPALPPVETVSETEDDGLLKRNMTIEDLIEEVLLRDPNLKSAIVNQRRGEIYVDSAMTAFSPTLTVGSSAGGADSSDGPSNGVDNSIGLSVYTPTGTSVGIAIDASSSGIGADSDWGSTAGLSVSQKLLDGGGMDVNLATLRKARLDAEIAALDTHANALSLVVAALGKFYDLHESYQRMALRRDQVDFAHRHLNRVRAKTVIKGEDPLAVQESSYSMMLAEKDLLGEQRTLRDTEDYLLDYLQAHFTFHLVPVFEFDSISVEEEPPLAPLLTEALERRDDLKRQALVVHKARLDKSVALNKALPDLSGYGGVGANYSGANGAFGAIGGTLGGQGYPYWSLGVSMAYAIGGGADPLELERVALALQSEVLKLEELTENAKREVRVAHRACTTARKQLEVALAAREIADQKLSLAVAAFRAGTADSFKVLSYQDDYLNARLDVVGETSYYLQARLGLDKATGVALDAYQETFEALTKAL